MARNWSQTLEILRKYGFELPKGVHRLQEAMGQINPITGQRTYRGRDGRYWSFDPQEGHVDACNPYTNLYERLGDGGRSLGVKPATWTPH